METIRLTVAEALVKFLDNQYVSFDGVENKFVEHFYTIFGHGCVVGVGEALKPYEGSIHVMQGKNEQGMANAAVAFAKQNNRLKIIPCLTSIGPGAANMVTAAALATVNNLPLLLLPGDTFASRQPDPVLQQIEQPNDLTITTNDVFKPVVKFFDRVVRPEGLMTAALNAMRILTSPSECGAVCISLPQDVQGESYDYPAAFFDKRVHRIERHWASVEQLQTAVKFICQKKKPLLIVGGGARYSGASQAVQDFAKKFNIPIAETQAGKSVVPSSFPLNLGGIGVTGNLAANQIAKTADLVIGVGTRYSDFTTASKSLFEAQDVEFVSINTSDFHSAKLDSLKLTGDAMVILSELLDMLKDKHYKSGYKREIAEAQQNWQAEYKRLAAIEYCDKEFVSEQNDNSKIDDFKLIYGEALCQTTAIAAIRDTIDKDAIVVGAAGSLPGCLQRMWTTDVADTYNMEYGYSTMGYEIAGAFGSKLAAPSQEVYAFTGDGSYLMLHSEMITALQEGVKINVLLFDNGGFGCIDNLQNSQGSSFMTEFRFREGGQFMPIDFAMSARGYGLKTYTVKNKGELVSALQDAKKQTVSTLIDIKVYPKTMTHGYGGWWNVGYSTLPKNDKQRAANDERVQKLRTARRY